MTIKLLRQLYLCGVLLLVGMSFSVAHAQTINEQIAFYGTLQNSSGTNLSGTYDMVFRFYDAPTGGTLLDTSTHTAANGNPVTVSEGEFGVVFGTGTGNTLAGFDFNAGDIYVGVSIESQSESSPRTHLTASAYAFNTDQLDGCDASCFFQNAATGSMSLNESDTLLTVNQDGAGDIFSLTDSGAQVFVVSDGGNVGVGSSSPQTTLAVGGTMQLTGTIQDGQYANGSNGQLLTSQATSTAWLATSTFGGGGGSSLFTDAGAYTYLTGTQDFLGVGTTSASSLLTISGGNLNLSNGSAIYVDNQRFITGSSSGNLGFGYNAGSFGNTGVHNLFFSTNAGGSIVGANSNYNILMGTNAGSNALNLNYSIGISERAAQYASGTDNFYYGTDSGASAAGDYNFGIGEGSLRYVSGDHNVALGYYAGAYNGGGDSNVLLGSYAGQNWSGSDSVLLGYGAGVFSANTGTTSNIIASGNNAAQNARGEDGIFFGVRAGEDNGRGTPFSRMLVLGGSASRDGFNPTRNTVIGHTAASAFDGIESAFLGGYGYYGDNRVTSAGTPIGSVFEVNDDHVIGFGTYSLLTTSNVMTLGNVIFGDGLAATGTTMATGTIGIGVRTPTAQFHTTGSIRFATFGAGTLQTDATGNLSVSSDERLKNIQTLYTAGIDALLDINPITYQWNEASGLDTNGTYLGFSAQNVLENIPEAVGEDSRGFLTLSDRGILATVVNAVKEVWTLLEGVRNNNTETTELLQDAREDLQTANALASSYEARIAALNQELGRDPETTNATDSSSDTETETGSTDPVSATTTTTATTTADTSTTTPTAAIADGPEQATTTTATSTDTTASTSIDQQETATSSVPVELEAESPDLDVSVATSSEVEDDTVAVAAEVDSPEPEEPEPLPEPDEPTVEELELDDVEAAESEELPVPESEVSEAEPAAVEENDNLVE